MIEPTRGMVLEYDGRRGEAPSTSTRSPAKGDFRPRRRRGRKIPLCGAEPTKTVTTALPSLGLNAVNHEGPHHQGGHG